MQISQNSVAFDGQFIGELGRQYGIVESRWNAYKKRSFVLSRIKDVNILLVKWAKAQHKETQ